MPFVDMMAKANYVVDYIFFPGSYSECYGPEPKVESQKIWAFVNIT